jgi:DNA-binding transcriptional ArsR family regulator
MICYMPFTHIEDRLLDRLTGALGTVTVYCPHSGMVSDRMQAAAREKKLDLRPAHGVRAEDLDQAVREFQAWADLHGGDIADLASLSKSLKGRPPLVDETNPTSIGDQVRHFGEQNPNEAADPVFQAALFLNLAQRYDLQQSAVSQDLKAVRAMEQVMLSRLAGGAEGLEKGIGTAPAGGGAAEPSDAGALMTARRVQSWAELACADTESRSFILYVTSSPAVLEHILDQFEQAQEPLEIGLAMDSSGTGHCDRKVAEALEALASAKNPAAAAQEGFRQNCNDANTVKLTICALAGISPEAFPRHLLSAGNRPEQGTCTGGGLVNTLIGLVEK